MKSAIKRTAVFFLMFALVAPLCGCEKKQEADSVRMNHDAPAFLEAAFHGQTEAVVQALENGMPVNQTDENGNSALMLAAFNGETDTLEALLEAGADPVRVDRNGRNALMFAASGPFPKAVRMLLENGAVVNTADSTEQFTALMFAAGEGHMEVVNVLLEYGADPDRKDADGDTAASFARERGYTNVYARLQRAGSDKTH